jgi:hypothetical protein
MAVGKEGPSLQAASVCPYRVSGSALGSQPLGLGEQEWVGTCSSRLKTITGMFSKPRESEMC